MCRAQGRFDHPRLSDPLMGFKPLEAPSLGRWGAILVGSDPMPLVYHTSPPRQARSDTGRTLTLAYWQPPNSVPNPLRARGPGRGRPVVTGSLANAIGRIKTALGPFNLFCHPLRARGPGRGRPVVTGSLANAIGPSKQHWGLRRASLRHFALARGCRRIWRGEFWFIGFAGAMLLEAIGPPGRCRGGVVMIYWFRRPRVNPSYHPYAREGQAVVCPLLRGRSPTRSVAPKQHRGLGRASLRHFGLARGAEESGAA